MLDERCSLLLSPYFQFVQGPQSATVHVFSYVTTDGHGHRSIKGICVSLINDHDPIYVNFSLVAVLVDKGNKMPFIKFQCWT